MLALYTSTMDPSWDIRHQKSSSYHPRWSRLRGPTSQVQDEVLGKRRVAGDWEFFVLLMEWGVSENVEKKTKSDDLSMFIIMFW